VIRLLLIGLGTVFLALGVIGVLIPGLPTTPFVLLAAAMYVRSSERLYARLANHRIFGKIIREYRINRSISARAKLVSIFTMWAMIVLSIILFVASTAGRIVIAALGIAGTVVLLILPTTKPPTGKSGRNSIGSA